MKIVVGTTLTTFAMGDPGVWGSWLKNMVPLSERTGAVDMSYFVAVETDRRGQAPFADLLAEHVNFWTYRLDDGRTRVTMENRCRHIAMGQNLVLEYATYTEADWLLLVASDMVIPEDAVEKFLELHNHRGDKAIGGHVDAHPVKGRARAGGPAAWNLEYRDLHSGFLFLHRDVFRKVRCRVEGIRGDRPLCDDLAALGHPLVVRKDVVGLHYPPAVSPYEQRHRRLDLEVR